MGTSGGCCRNMCPLWVKTLPGLWQARSCRKEKGCQKRWAVQEHLSTPLHPQEAQSRVDGGGGDPSKSLQPPLHNGVTPGMDHQQQELSVPPKNPSASTFRVTHLKKSPTRPSSHTPALSFPALRALGETMSGITPLLPSHPSSPPPPPTPPYFHSPPPIWGGELTPTDTIPHYLHPGGDPSSLQPPASPFDLRPCNRPRPPCHRRTRKAQGWAHGGGDRKPNH